VKADKEHQFLERWGVLCLCARVRSVVLRRVLHAADAPRHGRAAAAPLPFKKYTIRETSLDLKGVAFWGTMN
jgi:hypothetical protein